MSVNGCSDCRYQLTGWDGGFDGEPMTCECKLFGQTVNRKACSKFKRPFPKGYALLGAFRLWYNENIDNRISLDDLHRFMNEWK